MRIVWDKKNELLRGGRKVSAGLVRPGPDGRRRVHEWGPWPGPSNLPKFHLLFLLLVANQSLPFPGSPGGYVKKIT
jgi:hypothetical protein